MRWTIELDRQAVKDLERIATAEARRILAFLHGRLARLDDLRSMGDPLKGGLAGPWKYRVGAYRIIAEIQDGRVVVLIVRIGHRSAVYRGH